MKRLLYILSIALPLHASAQKISVSLFNNLKLQTILVTPVSGSYSIIMGDTEFILGPNQIVYISRSGDSVMVRDMASNLGTWERVSLVGRTGDDAIRISPITPSAPARVYDDNFGFYIDFERVMAINLVSMPNYIAGVVEAESGPSAQIEFYKAQAMLAQTYALGHMARHSGEGFNLCDEVHCQVYKGKSMGNPNIIRASNETNGSVVIDTSGELITGAFHANCGGQTAESGQVWLRERPYLASVSDTYCRNMPGSQWDVRIPIDEWREFLRGRGVDVDNIPDSKLALSSKNREYIYEVGGVRIPMTAIREHFKLRSAYFTVEVTSSNIRLRGRGYGHGVGMCQEGAMQMARRGFNAESIIKHYFQGVEIVDYSELNLNHVIDIDETKDIEGVNETNEVIDQNAGTEEFWE